jgi:hypothetical protein
MDDVKQCPCRGSNEMCGCQNRLPEGVVPDRALPDKIMVWRGNPSLDHTGTWATTRYPDDAVAYAPVDDAVREAVGLARALHHKHYQEDAPQWEPLDTVTGVISQIDNMTAGMSDEITALRTRLAELKDALRPFAEKHPMGEAYVRFSPRLIHQARAALADEART